jgi:amino acid transporter
MARDHLQSAKWVFTGYINQTGWENDGLAFLLGMLQAGWCLIGYVAPAQIVEGTKRSDVTAPRGIIYCVVGSIIQGLILLIPTLFAIQDVDALLTSSNPLATFFQQTTNTPMSVFLMVILLVAQFGSLANNSLAIAQLLWALSRDGVIPFSKFWYKLNRFDIPHRCLILELLIVVGIIMPVSVSHRKKIRQFSRLIWSYPFRHSVRKSTGRPSCQLLSFVSMYLMVYPFSAVSYSNAT